MNPDDVRDLIAAGLPGAQVTVQGDGSHFDAIVISTEFTGKTPVKKQQMVYATLGDRITSGAIHALSIQTFTPEEWAAR